MGIRPAYLHVCAFYNLFCDGVYYGILVGHFQAGAVFGRFLGDFPQEIHRRNCGDILDIAQTRNIEDIPAHLSGSSYRFVHCLESGDSPDEQIMTASGLLYEDGYHAQKNDKSHRHV